MHRYYASVLKLHHAQFRRGAATVLAMIFVVIFVSLAIAIATEMTTSIKSIGNQQSAARARASADSGLEFFKSLISKCTLEGSPADDELLGAISAAVTTSIPSLAPAATVDGSGEVVRLAFGEIRPLNGDVYFSATLDRLPQTSGGKTVNYLVLSITGRDARQNLARTVSTRFYPEITSTVIPLPIFDFGVFAAGGVTLNGGGRIAVENGTNKKYGSVLSAKTSGLSVKMGGSFSIPGKAFVRSSVASQVTYGNNSVNGVGRPYDPPAALAAWLQNNFEAVAPPEIPQFETAPFSSLATTTWVPPSTNVGGVVQNARIARGSGTPSNPLSISGNGTLELQGIVYIESPNNVLIKGGPNKLNCTFVFEKGTSTTDSLELAGNTVIGPIPDTSTFSAVRTALDGYSFLAPTAKVTLSASSNAGDFLGSLVCSKVKISGGSNFRVKNGSVIALSSADDAAQLVGSGSVYFKRDADFHQSTTGMGGAGIRLSIRYIAMPRTYVEAN